MPKPQAKAKRTLNREQVPDIPDVLTLALGATGQAVSGIEKCSNGDYVVIVSDQRWRFNAEGVLKYYFRTQPGKGRDVLPYEEMYRG